MSHLTTRSSVAVRLAGTLVALTALASTAHAQQFGQNAVNSLNAQVNGLTSRIQAAQSQTLQNGMNNPTIRAAYQQYYSNSLARGQRPIDFASYAYQYMATGGFSAQGRAALAASNAQNTAKVAAAAQDLRNAQAARGQAQIAMQNSFNNNQATVGQLLRGTSTFVAGNGAQVVLPHTWQANTVNYYEGSYYAVNASGNYFVLGADRSWYPLSQR